MVKLREVIDPYDGNALEELAHRLLARKFGQKNYQRLPAAHKGDKGIEGYTLDGSAFQCYAPQRQYSVAELYEHQRTKITQDIQKFISNGAFLGGLIQPALFNRWFLVTPEHSSAQLNNHAASKTAEVLRAGCPHVSPDFRIMIVTAEEFFVEELLAFIQAGANQVNFQLDVVDGATATDWATANVSFVETLQRKLKKLPGMTPEKISKYTQSCITDFLNFKAIIARLNKDMPDLHESVSDLHKATEETIDRKSTLGTITNGTQLAREMTQYQTELESRFGRTFGATTIGHMMRGTFADWLFRCPVDFPDSGQGQ